MTTSTQVRQSRRRRKQAKVAKRQSGWQRFWIIAGLVPLVTLLVGLVTTISVFAYVDSLIPEDLILTSPEESSFIFDRNGNVLYEIFGDERRTYLPIDQIPQVVKDATIALEDQKFYTHGGIDPQAIVRAAFLNIQTDATTGGSTITQQLVKGKFLSAEKTLDRKLQEALIAVRINQTYTKNEILEAYLNQINYGSQAYGIQAAAERYFGKNAADLNLAEAAILAGFPQLPTHNNLFSGSTRDLERQLYVYDVDNPTSWLHEKYVKYSKTEGERPVIDRWRQRQIRTLNNMIEMQMITVEEAEAALEHPIESKRPFDAIEAPHFVMYVQQLLYEKFGEELIRTEGYRIYTSLDLELQKEAERIVREQIDRIREPFNANNAALVAIEPGTGQILAHVGSVDYFDTENDGNVDVANSPHRQPGSSFKPFAYAAALLSGYNSETMVMDVSTDFGASYRPANYDLRDHGPVTMRSALANSYNIPAVKYTALAGVDKVIEVATDLGLTTLDESRDYGLSLGLGSGEAKLYDMVHAYATMANLGKKIPLNPIIRIEDRHGKIIEEFEQPAGEQVIDAGVPFIISEMLADNFARMPAFGGNNPLQVSRKAAAKTGTTNDIKDNWTIGYTPNLVTGVWVGNNDNTSLSPRASGVTGAAPIWNSFMEKAFEKIPEVPWYEMPQSVSWMTVDNFSGMRPGEFTGEETRGALVLREFINSTPTDTMRKRVVVDKQNGLLVNPLTPEESREEMTFFDIRPRISPNNPTYGLWMSGIENWTSRHREALLSEGRVSNYGVPTEVSPNYYNESNTPTVELDGVGEGHVFDTRQFSVTASALSPFPIQMVTFSIGDTLVGQIDGQQASYTQAFTLSDGDYTLVVRATDENGVAGEARRTISVNTQFQVRILSPGNNSYSGRPVELQIRVNAPNGFEEGVIEVDGKEERDFTQTNFDTSLNLSDGKRQITVTATSEDGKTSTATIAVTVDNNRPRPFSITGDCSTVAAGENCTLSAAPEDDDSGIARVRFMLSGAGVDGTVAISEATSSPASVVFNQAEPGNYQLSAIAYDRAGNERESSRYSITVTE